MREPHSKPKVRRSRCLVLPLWFARADCCGDSSAFEAALTWREAMDAALAHVAEVHTPQPCGRRDGTSDADIEAMYHFDALNRAHNQGARA